MRPSRLLAALVLAFAAITVLAVIFVRETSVLVVILWGGLAAICLADLLSSVGSRNLVLDVKLPESGYTGTNVTAQMRIEAVRGQLPRRFELRPEFSDGLASDWFGAFEPPARASAVTIERPVRLPERGLHRVKRLSMKFGSRLRLFEIITNRVADAAIKVVPNINPILSGEIHTRMLPLMDGLKDMNLRGEGSEFHQLREFANGMDPRSIDWKRSARMRSLIARETRAERNHQIMLCIDTGHLMAERIGDLSKLDHAINAALALTWAGGLGGDLVGFYSFDSRPQQLIPARPGRSAFPRIQSACAALQQDTAETNHTLGLSHLNSKLARRSLVIVFSDFVDSVTAELLIENLAVMTRHHLVLYVAMRDPAVRQFVQPDEITMDAVAAAVSARRLLQERQTVLDRLQRLGILCLDTDPASLTPSLISRYIDIKAQELI